MQELTDDLTQQRTITENGPRMVNELIIDILKMTYGELKWITDREPSQLAQGLQKIMKPRFEIMNGKQWKKIRGAKVTEEEILNRFLNHQQTDEKTIISMAYLINQVAYKLIDKRRK